MNHRFVISLESRSAAKLANLASRAGADREELAGSLLSAAIDAADETPKTVTELLESSETSFARAQIGLRQGRAGHTIRADQL